jgi:hypothetical protein
MTQIVVGRLTTHYGLWCRANQQEEAEAGRGRWAADDADVTDVTDQDTTEFTGTRFGPG